MWQIIIDILKETALDGLKMLPFLFGAYLLLEWVEHRSGEKLRHALSHSGRYSVPLGAAIGLIPQCGFSVAASNLYAGRLVTTGTLLAVFIATSDEAIPVMLASPDGTAKILPLLGLKLLFAILGGYLADSLFFRRLHRNDCATEHCKHDDERDEATRELCAHCGCQGGILKSALHHTAETFLFLVIVLLLINTATELLGEERLSSFLLAGTVWSPIVTALVGLIPNCAPSVLITELYINGTLSLGAAVAGLSAGAGLGVAMLFRINPDRKQNLRILAYLYLFAVVVGMVTDGVIHLL